MRRGIVCALVLILAGASCSRDPEVVKRKYLQNGNRYFERQKYKEAYIMYRNALKKDPKYSEAYYRAGLTELKLNRPYEALRDFRRASDTDPNFLLPDARVQAGNVLLAAYLYNEVKSAAIRDEIRDLADRLLKHDPKSVAALRMQGYLKLVADRDPKGAIERFQAADRISPAEPETVLPLVQSLLSDGQKAEAERMGRSLLEKRKDFAPMYDVLATEFMRTNRLADAEQMLRAKAANLVKDPGPQLQLALFYYRAGRRPDMEAVLRKITANSAYPDAHRQVGRFYGMIRDYDAAIREFQAGMQTDEKNKGDYQRETAQALIGQGKKAEAARLLEQVLKDNPRDDRAQAMRAALMLETGQPQQIQAAVDSLQAAVAQDGKNAVLRFNLGRALVAANQPDRARLQFQEAVKLQPAYMAARLSLAQLYVVRRDYANAIEQTRQILQLDPRNLAAKLIRTSALASMNDRIQARNELSQILQENPNSPEAAIQLAIINLSEQRYKEAEDIFARIYKAQPADLRALMGLSETYAAQKQWEKAEQLIQAELAKHPGRLELHGALGNIEYRAGRYSQAIEQFQILVQARPDSGDAYIRLGQAYRMNKDVRAAIRTFDKARQLRPNDPAPYVQLALLWESQGEQKQARPIYEQILKLQPDNPIALNNLAYILTETGGDLDQALNLAQRARQKLPQDADVADTLGWIYIKKNLTENAVDIFRDLVNKYPERSTFHYHLGMALYQRGDKPQAKKELQSALTKKPSAEEAGRIREMLGKIG